jgi:hypothetical protein
MKNTYESMMEYVITHGADKDESRARLLLALFTRHKDISDLLKVYYNKSTKLQKYKY